MTPSPGGARQLQYARQDRLFGALERLENKETQLAAFEELKRLVKDMDAANLATLMHAAGTQNAKTTQFARVHSLRLAALCTMPQQCMQWRSMLQPPLLGKLLGLLSRALRDADSNVRGTAAETFGIVAAQQAAAHPKSEASAGDAANPLLVCILEALGEPSSAVQAAAANALAQAVDHLAELDPALLRQLLRALNNPLFLGRAELWPAVARLEEGRVHGLLASSFSQVLAVMPEVLGSVADGTGLLGALTGRGKDFQLRAAAANTLKALAVGVGPSGAGWDVACAALREAKTDVSKPVRDAALAALPVVAGLQEFISTGTPPNQWPAVCGSLLAETGRTTRRGQLVGRTKAAPLAAGCVAGGMPAVHEQCIPAVHAANAAAAPGHQYGMPLPPPCPPAVGPFPGTIPWAGPEPSLPGPEYPAIPAAPCRLVGPPSIPAGMLMLPVPALPAAPPLQRMGGGSGTYPSSQLAAQLACIQEEQARMAAALTTFTATTQGTLHQLQQHLASVSAGVAVLAGGAVASGGAQHQQPAQQLQQAAQLQQQLAAVQAGMAALAVGVVGAPAPLPVPAASSPAPASVPMPCPKRLSGLHRSYQVLEQLHHQHQHQHQHHSQPQSPAAAAAKETCASPALPAASGGVASPAAASPASPSSPGAAAGPPCWEATYSQLLGPDGAGSSQQTQLQLLRCMAKSGPVWEQLGSGTGQRLMQAICCLLREGIALKHLLPWLWPLADTATSASKAAAAFPLAVWQELLAALAAYPLPIAGAAEVEVPGQLQQQGANCSPAAAVGAEDDGKAGGGGGGGGSGVAGLRDKRDLLVCALRAVWE